MSNETLLFACREDDIDDDDVLGLKLNGTPVALYKVEGEIYATHGICTHDLALMADGYLEDHIIECPLHAGTFDVRTGKAIAAPCKVDIATYPVVRKDGDVYLNMNTENVS